MDKENIISNQMKDNSKVDQRVKRQCNRDREYIINLKKEHLNRLKIVQNDKDQLVRTIKQKYEDEKEQMIKKYEKIVNEKQQYIRMLEELTITNPSKILKQQTNSHQLARHQLALSEDTNTEDTKIKINRPSQINTKIFGEPRSSSRHKLRPAPQPSAKKSIIRDIKLCW